MGRHGVRGALIAALLGCAPPSPIAAPAPSAVSAPFDAGDRRAEDAPTFRRCDRCHVRIAAEHGRTLHARAATDPLFLREVERVPDRTFCDRCHGVDEDPPGIGCGACHDRDGAIVSASASGSAPHEVLVDPAIGTDALCARCHQFDFPGRPGERMQRTLDEAAAMGEARAPCASCHLPHDARIDEDELARALRVSVRATRVGDRVRVRFVLRPGDVGHAVPTGDLYRNLEVRAWPSGAPSRARLETLSRRLAIGPGGPHEVGDVRVPPTGARLVTLELPAAETSRVAWSIDWLALPRARGERSTLPEGWWVRRMRDGVVRVAE